jgi:hypothetical protein
MTSDLSSPEKESQELNSTKSKKLLSEDSTGTSGDGVLHLDIESEAGL